MNNLKCVCGFCGKTSYNNADIIDVKNIRKNKYQRHVSSTTIDVYRRTAEKLNLIKARRIRDGLQN